MSFLICQSLCWMWFSFGIYQTVVDWKSEKETHTERQNMSRDVILYLLPADGCLWYPPNMSKFAQVGKDGAPTVQTLWAKGTLAHILAGSDLPPQK